MVTLNLHADHKSLKGKDRHTAEYEYWRAGRGIGSHLRWISGPHRAEYAHPSPVQAAISGAHQL